MFELTKHAVQTVSGGTTREDVDAFVAQMLACQTKDELDAVLDTAPYTWWGDLNWVSIGPDGEDVHEIELF